MTRVRVVVVLLIAKLAAGAAAWFVVGGSFQLGDTEAYLAGEYLARRNPLSTAYLMSAAGAAITAVVGVGYLANVPLNVLAWAGLARETRPLRLGSRAWLGLLVLLLSPSYLLWTSVHSKEAAVNFLLGWVLCHALLQAKGGEASPAGWVTAGLAGVVLGLFKPLFLPAVLWALLLTRVVPRVDNPRTVSLGAAVAASGVGVVLLIAAAPILEP